MKIVLRVASILLLVVTVVTPFAYGSYLDQDKAVIVIVPVADAVGNPLQCTDLGRPVEDLYRSLPFSPEAGPVCPRIHQFIFNEVGHHLDTTPDGSEVLIEFPHLYHQNERGERQNTFWMLAKNVLPLDLIRKKLGNLSGIPEPIQSSKPEDPRRFDHILTLILPWTHSVSGIMYSAGTRFKRAAHLDTNSSYGIYFLNATELTLTAALVPREIALVDYPHNKTDAKKLFVEILKKWAMLASGKIAYVWGGCSILETYPENVFYRAKVMKGNDTLECWERPHAAAPHGGCDCSGLVLRAAQIAGLPYFCKNTKTIGATLKECNAIEAGDLILLPRHVIVMSDILNPAIVQAVSYSSGYGVVHEKPLHSIFENIHTYAELYHAWKNKLPLTLKNKKGGHLKTIDSFRLLSLS